MTPADVDALVALVERWLRAYRLAVRATVIREMREQRVTCAAPGTRSFAGRWRPVVVAGGPAKREKR